jgi:hypothetical protein
VSASAVGASTVSRRNAAAQAVPLVRRPHAHRMRSKLSPKCLLPSLAALGGAAGGEGWEPGGQRAHPGWDQSGPPPPGAARRAGCGCPPQRCGRTAGSCGRSEPGAGARASKSYVWDTWVMQRDYRSAQDGAKKAQRRSQKGRGRATRPGDTAKFFANCGPPRAVAARGAAANFRTRQCIIVKRFDYIIRVCKTPTSL